MQLRSIPATLRPAMKFSRLTYSIAVVFLCYGAVVFSFGPCLTSMADTFQLPVGKLGLIFTLYAVGLLPSVLLNGYLSEVLGRRPLLLAVIAMMVTGCLLAGFVAMAGGAANYPYLLAAMVLLGFGGGGIEILANILVTDDNQPAPAFALNVTHAFFAIGAVLSPGVVSLLLRSDLPWQYVFYGNAALLTVIFVLLLPQHMPRAISEPFPFKDALGLLRFPLVWTLLAMITFYVGAEMGISAWVSPLMEKTIGGQRDIAGLSVSVFWAVMIVGRIAISPLSVRYRPPQLLLVLGFGSALSALAIAYTSSAVMCLVATGLAGLFMAGIFVLVLVDASRHFPQRLGAIYGIIMAGVGVGSLIFPAAMGWLSEVTSLRTAMLLPAGLMGIVGTAYVIRWSQ